jgi:hypothetical protein
MDQVLKRESRGVTPSSSGPRCFDLSLSISGETFNRS